MFRLAEACAEAFPVVCRIARRRERNASSRAEAIERARALRYL
ncbi:MAG TPA: hypothetical protein VK866_00825 [Acidimicrobiales bacterium]|nr:hypothetical protein [Acidimicrobiales bacterium]